MGIHEFTLGHAPSVHLDGHSASRVTFRDISVEKGDTLKIRGQPGLSKLHWIMLFSYLRG